MKDNAKLISVMYKRPEMAAVNGNVSVNTAVFPTRYYRADFAENRYLSTMMIMMMTIIMIIIIIIILQG